MIHRYDVRFWLMFRLGERVVIAGALALFLFFSCDSHSQFVPDAMLRFGT